MKKILFILITLFSFSSVYASFPVSESVESSPITTTVENSTVNTVVEPIVASGSGWQGIVSLGLATIAWFIIGGLYLSVLAIGFGIWGITGDKRNKWMAWVGMGMGILGAIIISIAMSVV